MDPASLFVGLLVSLVGTAYMVYGRMRGIRSPCCVGLD